MYKILFLVGSMNQTTQMHKIARELPGMDCWFSQTYSDSWMAQILIKRTEILDNTILSGQFKRNTDQYLRDHHLQVDYEGKLNTYDMVFHCTDMVLPKALLKSKTVWIQEGMVDPFTWKSALVKKMGLPLWMTNDTSLNGTSNGCDLYFVGSQGYKEHFAKLGTEASKIFVTGMPNYDDVKRFLQNDFPHKGYVMVATSDIRETARKDNRIEFIQDCVRIASGRPLLFKLHPNERVDRASEEIRAHTPSDTLIFSRGNTNEMIANSVELITQYSTVVYIGMALGLPVHSYFNLEELRTLCPIQNNGRSAKAIAKICSDFLDFKEEKSNFVRQYHSVQECPDLALEKI